MNEIWKDIENYEGLYQVSNLGNVRSLNYDKSGRIQNFKLNKKEGYLQVKLCKPNHTPIYPNVHRLVAKAFIQNPNNYPIVNHKDCNKQNNCVDNLEWCTYSYNIKYAVKLGRLNSAENGAITSTPIYAIDKIGNKKLFNSQKEAERELKISQSSINNVLRGRNLQLNGYVFIYENQIDQITPQELRKRFNGKKKPIYAINSISNKKYYFDSAVDASKELNININSIRSVLNKKQKMSKGYYFIFCD